MTDMKWIERVDKHSWMVGFEAGMKTLAAMVATELQYRAPPTDWDADEQALAEQVWEERT